ncbi:hypothetical protein CJU89_6693 [Yarrowia sp. B02]|nr:hypothetical protein CJU89_6693 [Yarrowia sp. B02]
MLNQAKASGWVGKPEPVDGYHAPLPRPPKPSPPKYSIDTYLEWLDNGCQEEDIDEDAFVTPETSSLRNFNRVKNSLMSTFDPRLKATNGCFDDGRGVYVKADIPFTHSKKYAKPNPPVFLGPVVVSAKDGNRTVSVSGTAHLGPRTVPFKDVKPIFQSVIPGYPVQLPWEHYEKIRRMQQGEVACCVAIVKDGSRTVYYVNWLQTFLAFVDQRERLQYRYVFESRQMDWIFSEKPDPATPPVSWALGALPAMFQRETPHFERDLVKLRREETDTKRDMDTETKGERDTETTAATEPTFDNFLEMKASSTPFFKPEKVLKRRAVSELKTSPNKFPKTGGILKQTQTGANDTVSHFGHKNVSFAASLGSTTNSISEQLPSGYEGADQTPVASYRVPKFVQYDPVNDDTKTMFRKLDNNMDLLHSRRRKWSDEKEVELEKLEKSPTSSALVKSTEQVELELALNKIKTLEEDKRRYMVQSNKFEMEKRTVEHELDILKRQQRNEIDTMKMTIEHLQSKMSVNGCETRTKEHKLNVAEQRVSELQRELVDSKAASEERETHLQEQVSFFKEKIDALERKERAYRASEKIAMRQRDDFNKNWTFRHVRGGSRGSGNLNNFQSQNKQNFNNFENKNFQSQNFNNFENKNFQSQNLNQNQNFNQNNQNFNQNTQNDFHQNNQNFTQESHNNELNRNFSFGNQDNFNFTKENPFASTFNQQPTRQPLGSFDLNVKRNTSQKTRNIFGHARQPSTTPKQPPPSYLRSHDVEMGDGMRFFR